MQIINLTGSLRRRDIGVALVTEARRRDLSVAVLLRSDEDDFDPDVPGKDSYEHRKAGAREVLLASARARALMCEAGDGLQCKTVADRLDSPDVLLIDGDCHPGGLDLVIAENGETRLSQQGRLLSDPPGVIAALLIDETGVMNRTTALQNDCFAFDGPMAPFGEALDNLLSRVHPVVGSEQAALIKAVGRVLAEPVTARKFSPPHNNAAVDGFAVRHADLKPDGQTLLNVTARVAAGHPVSGEIRPGEAVQIFTGAVVPDGLDTIFMLEDCNFDGERVELKPGIRKGANLRHRGEDIAAGDAILQAGVRLRPQDIALAAAGGVATLPVFQRLKVAVFSTGDEVYDPAVMADPPAGGIFDANRYALAALLSDLGCELIDLGILPDRFDDIRAALAQAADQADAVITSGGVSLGEEDHVKAAVHDLGSLNPLAGGDQAGGDQSPLGQIGTTPFVGLPGNPVAVMVTFWMFARPLLLTLAGVSDVRSRRYQVRAGFERSFKGRRREWLRAWLEPDAAGGWRAVCYPREGSGIINSLVAAEGLVEIPEEMSDISIGDMIDFLPFSEVRR